MEIARPFHLYLNKFVNLSKEEFEEFLVPSITIKKFSKKELITKEGEVEDYLYFILSGLARKYYRKDETEVNTQISFEGHIIHSQESFHSRTPSEYFIEALEPCTCIAINYEGLEKIYSCNSKMERLGRRVITFTMVLKDRWQMQMIKLSPRERFLLFINKQPELLQRVPQKHLASFLNIQPETFSRFKHLVRPSASIK